MVKSAAILLALGALLAGCKDDLGENLDGGISGLVAPVSLRAVASSSWEVELTWQDRSTSENGFRLEYSKDVPFHISGAVPAFVIIASDTTAYHFTGDALSTYYFRIYAVTETMESDSSNETSVLTPQAPPAPTLSLLGADSSYINVVWVDAAGEIGYSLEYSENGAGWSMLPLTIGPDIQGAAMVPNPGSSYRIRLYAIWPLGLSTPSNEVSVSIPR